MSAPPEDLGTTDPDVVLPSLLSDLARGRLDGYLHDLRHLVSVDSGSYSPDGVNQVADWFAHRLARIGFETARIPVAAAPGEPPVGDILLARRAGSVPASDGGRRILVIGHMDTVFEDGTAAERPFARDGDRALGPGVSDDKGGLLAGLHALEILHAADLDDYAELVFLATPDEEIGSPASRPLTEKLAAEIDAALALECARENGDLVIARKGVADFQLIVTGRAAHAGIEPERGANAALAAAHLVIALQELNGLWDQVTVNVGVIRAGNRTNVVCSEARIHVEVRAATADGMRRAAAAITELARRTQVIGTVTQCVQIDWCPPMEDSPGAQRLLALYQANAATLGLEIDAAATGGVGDANFLGGLGVPTLDGLGPVGGGDHSPDEWLDVSSVTTRVALLATAIVQLGRV